MLPELYQMPEWQPHFDSEGIPFPDKIANKTHEKKIQSNKLRQFITFNSSTLLHWV